MKANDREMSEKCDVEDLFYTWDSKTIHEIVLKILDREKIENGGRESPFMVKHMSYVRENE